MIRCHKGSSLMVLMPISQMEEMDKLQSVKVFDIGLAEQVLINLREGQR